VTLPRDPATGLPTGKRRHAPVAFVKVWEFLETLPDGKEAVAYTRALTNAAVSAATLAIPGPPAVPAGATEQLQEVSLTFQKIEIRSLLGQTGTVDDWTGGA
jgi:hypothetical protein